MAAKCSKISCGPIINSTHMVAVYIIVPDIIIKFIRGTLYLRWRPFPFKLMYTQIVKVIVIEI